MAKSIVLSIAAFASLLYPASPVMAAGEGGVLLLARVHVEGGKVFLYGNFSNPDNCANSSVIVLAPHQGSNQELDRMYSMALSAKMSGKKVYPWLSGCVASNWYASIPQASALSVLD